MQTMSRYLQVMRTPNTLFLLIYSPVHSPRMVHLRGKLYRSMPKEQQPTWIDIRANCPYREFLETIIARVSQPGTEWTLSALTDASDPGF